MTPEALGTDNVSLIYLHHFKVGELYKNSSGEWVIKFNVLFRTADSDVHVVHNIQEHIHISFKKKIKGLNQSP